MTQEHNKAIERRMVAEALNKGNLAVVDDCLTPDFIYNGPGGTEVKGVEGYKQFLTGLRAAYPDIHVKIEDIIAEGDMVATRTSSTFTFTGRAGPVAPTNKKVTLTGSILDRFKDGQIRETWEQYDRLDLYQQMGLISTEPPRGS
jgi:predicted ester cyclase